MTIKEQVIAMAREAGFRAPAPSDGCMGLARAPSNYQRNKMNNIMKLADAYADAAYEANFDDSMTKARAALEAAVNEQAAEIETEIELRRKAEQGLVDWRVKYTELQAKLYAMEKQEPVAWLYWDANAGSRGFYKVDPLLPHTEGAFPVYTAPKVAQPDRVIECAARLVEHADFRLGGCLSADSKAKDIPSKAVSQVKSRHLAALRDALTAHNTGGQQP